MVAVPLSDLGETISSFVAPYLAKHRNKFLTGSEYDTNPAASSPFLGYIFTLIKITQAGGLASIDQRRRSGFY